MLLPLQNALCPLGRRRVPFGGVHSRWDNLFAGWKMDDESDGSAPVPRADVLGARDLTDINTVASTAGHIGNAIAPLGANAETLQWIGADFRASGDLTVSLWIYPEANPNGNAAIIENRTVGFARDYFFTHMGFTNKIRFDIWDSGGAGESTAFVTLTLDNWHHIVVQYDSGTKKGALILDDAAPALTPALVNGLRTDGDRFMIGHGGLVQQDWVDELYFFNVLKDAAWITDMHNGGVGRSYPN